MAAKTQTVSLAADFAPWEERIARGERVAASFKCEDFDGNREIGPFTLEALDEADKDPNLTPMEGRNGAVVHAMPFDYQPEWRYVVPFWVYRSDAVRFAKALGVELSES